MDFEKEYHSLSEKYNNHFEVYGRLWYKKVADKYKEISEKYRRMYAKDNPRKS